MLRTDNLTKRFGGLTAVDNVSYLLQENEVAGIIGSNGAGKTTFFNLLTGYHMPDEGAIRYKGEDITRSTPQQRVARGITRTFQLTATFDALSVSDHLVLSLLGSRGSPSLLRLLLQRRSPHRRNPKVIDALECFDLQAVKDKEARHLSLGEKRRLEIAMAILAEPDVLLLDEPLAGLSESEVQTLLAVMRRRIGRQTILLVEHKLSHVEGFLERLTVMHEGRIIADGGYEECLRHPEVRRSYWQIEQPDDAAAVVSA